jgi:undecaprenyl pyrophosphate phosphatase UppP
MPLLYIILALIAVCGIGWFVNRSPAFPNNARVVANIVLELIVVGIGLWLINTYIPMAASIKAILNIVVVIAVCVGVLQQVGLWGQVVRLWGNVTNHRFQQ